MPVYALVICVFAFLFEGIAAAEDLSRANLANEVSKEVSTRSPRAKTVSPSSAKGVVPRDSRPGNSFHFSPEDVETTAAVSPDDAEPKEVGVPAPVGGYRLNFERADIKDVVHAILSTTLGLNYTLAGDVNGQVTISSPRPLSREELLTALETTLAGQGLALTRAGSGYRVAPNALSPGKVSFGRAGEPGYGVTIVPLRYVSAAVMSRLVSGFVADADGLRFDVARNTMIVKGPAQRRQEAVNAILSFDADWMRGQSVSLFELRRARPDALVAELTQLFDTGENGTGAGLIQFKPIARLRTIMVTSKNPNLIRRAETYIRKLDSANETAEDNVFIYKARYRDARDLARVVNNLFGSGQGGMGGTGLDASRPSSAGMMGSGLSGSGAGGSGLGGSGGGFNSGLGGAGASTPNAGASGASGGESRGTDLLKARFAANFNDGNTFASGAGGGGPSYTAGPGQSGGLLDLTQRSQARRVAISVDPSNNAVVVYTDGESYRKIHAALRQLDGMPPQVAINVTIAEVKLTDQLKYGVQYYLDSSRIGLGKNKGSFGLVSAAASAAPNVLKPGTGGFNFLGGSYAGPDIVLSALDGFTDVKILSSPSLVVVENQPATLQVGDAVPITTRQAQSVEVSNAPLINQVEFRDTGIILNVIPRIGQDNAVTLQIEQEISAVVAAADTLTPTISKRRVASMISVANGHTVLLAGLISEKRQRERDGIPFLNRIPNVGTLFSSTDNSAERTELVVFIRPVVVRNAGDARAVTEDYRDKLLDAGVRRGARPHAPVYKP
ncbi:type II secretion system secretin GspD [Methylobacterium sp. SD21]|uniref:type II secretion system secretin GspD n=1 Tax=Methylobacterium litchii TaxID=3138810 RepID=UPI00313DC2AE